MAFLDSLKAFLDAQGVSSTLWPVKLTQAKDDSDQAIILSMAGGEPFDTLGRENLNPIFQAIVRGTPDGGQVAMVKWEEVFNAFADAQQVNGSPELLPGFIFIQPKATAPYQWWDDKGRPCLSTHYRCKVTR